MISSFDVVSDMFSKKTRFLLCIWKSIFWSFKQTYGKNSRQIPLKAFTVRIHERIS